jgi:penicillin-binding protein 1C
VKYFVVKLAHRSPETIVYWYLNENYLGSTKTFHEIALATNQESNELKQIVEILQASN